MLNFKRLICSLVFLLPAALPSWSATWETSGPGYWSSGFTWSGGVAPPYVCGDTILINYPVIFDRNLDLTQGSFLMITAVGGLCGHHNITVNTGAAISKYGILELDTLNVPGGAVTCAGPGDVVITYEGHFTNGGRMTVNGCHLAVGPWFNCRLPEFNFSLGVGTVPQGRVSLFPNPNAGVLWISGLRDEPSAVLRLRDLTGRPVVELTVEPNQTDGYKLPPGLGNGIYFWEIRSKDHVTARGTLSLQR